MLGLCSWADTLISAPRLERITMLSAISTSITGKQHFARRASPTESCSIQFIVVGVTMLHMDMPISLQTSYTRAKFLRICGPLYAR